MAMVGIGDFPARRDVADFVNYMRTGAQFYAPASRSAELKVPEDLCGKCVDASRGTKWPDQMRA